MIDCFGKEKLVLVLFDFFVVFVLFFDMLFCFIEWIFNKY